MEKSLQIVSTNHIFLLVLLGLLFVGAVFAILAVVISMLNYEENPVRDRLLLLKEKADAETRKKKRASGPFDDLKEAIILVSGPIAKQLYGQNDKYLQQVKGMLTEAGLPDMEQHVNRFLAIRADAGLVLGVVLGVIGFVLTMGQLIYALMGLIGGFLVGSLIPQFMLRNKATQRKLEIRYSMPDTLDLMVVCVEAGLGLDATIQRVSEETERMAPEISQEFRRLNKELNAGLSRIEAFQNLGQRAGVDELRALCAMIIQADKMGTSISDTLRVYADDLRTKRRQKAEELASKASIKMTFPLVLFIFPPLFIILMGPTVIQAIQQFFGAE